MSLALRIGGSFSVPQALLAMLPKLPAFPINSIFHNSPAIDERLEELREQIENNHGRPPFMIDNGTIVKAAPKKKMSKRRHRTKLYTPGDKQIHPLNNIVRCPACGHVKRSHFMCMNCFAEIRTFLKGKKRENGLIKDAENPQTNLDPVDEKLIYPGKYLKDDQIRLEEKKWIPVREEPLMFDKKHLKHSK
ncbi:mitochondrial ribosomal large subunit protein [Suhomyces tanzawaensis NRRL Y-17324]|uniref:Large ribosomal subunit protein bL32m n=1 Tax=Suhomyces tanzawaensis NRRL Y-17324 TaxID=984487 RepID=A0A1E4SKJ6_9ASCO|nr:mitochondrial ribosomal large subunit protein [Suhomyces tanzawaensis NRRL Y-17324]ODV80010.1 mitochondrial ribosomal large subunit protein [Suhomyces tanzawaensis NRRL Y-17324]